MKLSKRLLTLAGLVTKDDKVADIGCDHALLDIYLVLNNITDRVLVSDINENALNGGISNIKKYHLEDKIEAKLGNGIETITDDINTLIISGMGASTIIKILNNKKINQINKLIIQSNNDHYLLRNYLTSNGFYISYENVIYEKSKYYINIVFLRGHQDYNRDELIYGPILIKNGNKDYFEFLYNKNISILESIPYYKVFKRLEIIKQNLLLKKLKRK